MKLTHLLFCAIIFIIIQFAFTAKTFACCGCSGCGCGPSAGGGTCNDNDPCNSPSKNPPKFCEQRCTGTGGSASSCPPGWTLNTNTCNCEKECSTSRCADGTCPPTTCPGGAKRNLANCTCECDETEGYIQCKNGCVKCGLGMVLDPATCGCTFCLPPKHRCKEKCIEACTGGKTFNSDSCQCGCPANTVDCAGQCVEACPAGQARSTESNCECKPCDPPKNLCKGVCYPECTVGEEFDEKTCECGKLQVKIKYVKTPCTESTPPCLNSFVEGDAVEVLGEAKKGTTDISGDIQWACTGTANGGLCVPAIASGDTYAFKAGVSSRMSSGRGGPISLTIKAAVLSDGDEVSESVNVTQDEIDQLRQEYYDMEKLHKPTRGEFVNAQTYVNPGHFSFDEINCKGDITTWAIFTITQHLENIRAIWNQPMTVNSAYRTPIYNASLKPPGAKNSRHIYGDAADIDVDNNNPQEWAALCELAVAKGACIEPYSMARGWVHMDWRTDICPAGNGDKPPWPGSGNISCRKSADLE